MVDIINDINCLLSLFFHPTENISGLKRVAFPRSDDRGYPSVGQNLHMPRIYQGLRQLAGSESTSANFYLVASESCMLAIPCIPKLQENQELLDKRDLK